MEASAAKLGIIEERMRSYDSRIRSNHDNIAKTRDRLGKQGENLIRIEAKLEEQSADIADLKKTLTWIVRGLFGAIAVGLMFVVAVGTLIIQAAH